MSAFPDLLGQDIETALGGVRECREKEIVKSFLRLTLRVASIRCLQRSDATDLAETVPPEAAALPIPAPAPAPAEEGAA